MKVPTLDVRDERLWKGSQTLNGSLIGYYGDILVRASIKRDAYDDQCSARIETWGRDGWTLVQYVPIEHFPEIFACSYGTTPERWYPLMRAELLNLCQLGYRILVRKP